MYNLRRISAVHSTVNHALQSRWASTASIPGSSKDPYPFPTHKHPTPYEIFHLAPGAPQSLIKSRYYELVRLHHPDSPRCRTLPSHVCRSRFQAISAAYDVLTGKSAARLHRASGAHSGADFEQELHRRHRRHAHARNSYGSEWAQYRDASSTEDGAGFDVDGRWKDRLIMALGLSALAFTVGPMLSFYPSVASEGRHRNAAQNLAQARRDAREFGELRRREIRKRVRVNESDTDTEQQAARTGEAGVTS